MLKIHELTKIYRTDEIQTKALNKINLEVGEGEFIAVMGPSGCGKSTLLHVLGLIDDLSDGQYLFLDEDVSGYSERKRSVLRKKNIGFVFQSFNLINELTVYENVELPLIYNKIPTRERKERIENVLEKMDITARRNHYPGQLSGGQQQRAAVARAVVGKPCLILADEPTGNLDSGHGQEVMELLQSLNDEGVTLIMVTHSRTCADYAQRTVNLFDGAIVTESRHAASGLSATHD